MSPFSSCFRSLFLYLRLSAYVESSDLAKSVYRNATLEQSALLKVLHSHHSANAVAQDSLHTALEVLLRTASQLTSTSEAMEMITASMDGLAIGVRDKVITEHSLAREKPYDLFWKLL